LGKIVKTVAISNSVTRSHDAHGGSLSSVQVLSELHSTMLHLYFYTLYI